MNGKTWTFCYSSYEQAANDDLITTVLVNTYHIWQDVGEDREEVSFKEFCEMLAMDMISHIRN